jgi:tyrosine-protein kinase Etk/Wzc
MRPTAVEPDLQLTVHAPQLEEERGADLIDRVIVLGEHKLFIVSFVALAAVVALIVALLLPKTYEATTKIMPPQQNPSAAAALLSQLGPLANMAGRDLGLRNPSELYVDMLRSHVVADNLIQRFSLMQVYHDKDIADARKDLEEASAIDMARDSMISVTVSDRDPQRAADLANAYIEELQKLTQTLAVTEAGRRRLFFEQEVQKAGDDLVTAELALKKTQEKTGIIQLDSQSRAMIESLTLLQAQLTAKEAQVEAMRSFATTENPEFVRARQEVEALRSELSRVKAGQGITSLADISTRAMPEAGLEYVRRLRDVRYHESLLEVLTKQYEIARIDQAKEAAIIQALDKASRPNRKSKPHRALIVLITMFCALFVAMGLVLVSESFKHAQEDPVQAARFQRLKSSLLGYGRTRK